MSPLLDIRPREVARELSRVDKVVDNRYAAPVGANSVAVNGYMLGLTAPVGPGLIRASYGNVR